MPCNPIDCSPPGPFIHGILQASTLEWVSISFSQRNYRKKESEVAQSCLTLSNPMDCTYQALPSMEFSRQEYWSGLLFPSSENKYTIVEYSCHLLVEHIQFTLIHGPNIPGSYEILFFTASDFTFTTFRHIQIWASYPLWPRLFIPSGAISPLSPSSIWDTCRPGGLIFRCHIFLPFHTVHEVLEGGILVCHSLFQWTMCC